MPALLLGVLVLILFLWGSKALSKADPKKAAPILRSAGGGAALLFAAFLLFRGEIGIAVPIAVVGLGLLGWVSPWTAGFRRRVEKNPGQVSRVRSAFLEMELDHDSGSMRGRILAGPYEGASLDSLDPDTLVDLLGGIDNDSRQLMMAYLDRRTPRWREHAEQDSAAGRHGSAATGGKMTEEEAYQILGIQSGASAQEIARAHRSLMKKLHPDQGGSTYLAARVNAAKDVLLRRHR